MKRSMLACAAVALVFSSVFAVTETINDLKPYDNTIANDGFWDTTQHSGVEVSSQTVILESFDSKLFDFACVDLTSFSSQNVGFFIIYR